MCLNNNFNRFQTKKNRKHRKKFYHNFQAFAVFSWQSKKQFHQHSYGFSTGQFLFGCVTFHKFFLLIYLQDLPKDQHQVEMRVVCGRRIRSRSFQFRVANIASLRRRIAESHLHPAVIWSSSSSGNRTKSEQRALQLSLWFTAGNARNISQFVVVGTLVSFRYLWVRDIFE